MTINEFLEELKKITNRYRWTRWPQIRGGPYPYNNFKFCPITAVAFELTNKQYSENSVDFAGAVLGLDRYTVSKLSNAIDYINLEAELRSSIEEICFSQGGR